MTIRAVFFGVLPPRLTGVSFSLAQIVSGIARAGHQICTIAPITPETMKEGDWFAARHPELRVIRYWQPEFYIEPYKPQRTDAAELEREQINRLVRELATSFRPDVLIAGRESYGFLVRELAEELAIPWILFLRGSPTAQILSGLFPEDKIASFVDLYRSAGLLISVARYFSVGLEERYGIASIRTIPNALDLDVFRPHGPSATLRAEYGVPDDHRTVLLPGTLISRKRPLDFLMAAEEVRARNPAVVFLLAGTGPMHDELLGFCRERRLTDSARFLGYVPYARMPELYNTADLVVMTSEAEGMSRVYVEALACGRPLLASDILAARELIEDGKNGFLFEAGKHRHLAERVLGLLQERNLRAEVGRRARASVLDRSLETAIQAYTQEIEAFVRRGQG